MDKRVIFAVAGSGKTSLIIDQLSQTNRSLIITFTNNNLNNLRLGIIRKFGYFPRNILLLSYFSFLYSFCFKPFLLMKYRTKGINYQSNLNRFAKDDARFIDRNRRLYSNRIAKLIDNNSINKEINNRISKYFDNLYIDEVQDFAGHDFNLLVSMIGSDLNILLVGDFFQHTFDTSRDGNVNTSLHDDFNSYMKRFQQTGILVDLKTLNKSYRCSPTVCKFITESLGISIESHRTDDTNIQFIEDQDKAFRIFRNRSIVKLFYQEHYKYDCFSRNWGDSKGEDKYKSVCVVLNKNTNLLFHQNRLSELPPQTRNKFYVACSRARNSLYLLPEELLVTFKST
jgi:DNA helicase II / ATP-dependent DNA helicase PcrA